MAVSPTDPNRVEPPPPPPPPPTPPQASNGPAGPNPAADSGQPSTPAEEQERLDLAQTYSLAFVAGSVPVQPYAASTPGSTVAPLSPPGYNNYTLQPLSNLNAIGDQNSFLARQNLSVPASQPQPNVIANNIANPSSQLLLAGNPVDGRSQTNTRTWDDVRSGIQRQLDLESKLNAHDPEMQRALAQAALNYREGRFPMPSGTYESVSPTQRLSTQPRYDVTTYDKDIARLKQQLANPSPRIQQLDREIDATARELTEARNRIPPSLRERPAAPGIADPAQLQVRALESRLAQLQSQRQQERAPLERQLADLETKRQRLINESRRPSGPTQNPLAIPPFTGDAVARVQQYNRDIDTRTQQLADVNQRIFQQQQTAAQRGDPQPPDPLLTNQAKRLSDELSQLRDARNKFINDARLQASNSENAKMYRALANPADASKPPVIVINGVNTDINRSALEAMELSYRFRSPVEHVVNVSSRDGLAREIGNQALRNANLAQGNNQVDLDLRFQQQLSGNRPAATTAANAILDQMYNGSGPIRVVGYSQGAAIGSQALRDVEAHLSREVREGRLTQTQKEQMLGRVRFLGVGPAADPRHLNNRYLPDPNRPGSHVRESIPDMKHVNYRVITDINDPIPQLLNVGYSNANAYNQLWNVGRRLGNDPKYVLPHLSYFEHYQYTDPGSKYNARMKVELDNWFSGRSVTGITYLDQNSPTGLYRKK